jgi:hypothetical protein
MMDDFTGPTWGEAHEKFAENVVAGLTLFRRWLRRRTKAKDEAPAVTLRRGKGRRPLP